MDIQLHSFDLTDATHIQAVVRCWDAACGPELPISERFVRFNVPPWQGERCAGRLAMINDQPAGVVLVSALPDALLVNPTGEGWIDAIAVLPGAQHQGIGSALLAWATGWLREQGCASARLGGGLRPFVVGLPTALDSAGFFARRGFVTFAEPCDMAANLATYTPPHEVREVDAAVRPAQCGQEQALLDFLRREFPGRWRFEAEEHLRLGGRIADYMLLWTARGVDGCCVLTFSDSWRPLERYYPYALPKPWGQLGSVGVSADCRGQGFGAALLDGGLRRLHNNGVNGCVIDWVRRADFYEKFGFSVHRRYLALKRELG
jgi:GNAT superfamily N-acetyltransferase